MPAIRGIGSPSPGPPVVDAPNMDAGGGKGGNAPRPCAPLNPVVGFHATTPDDASSDEGMKCIGTAATPDDPPSWAGGNWRGGAAPGKCGNGWGGAGSVGGVLTLSGGVVVAVSAAEDCLEKPEAPLPDESADSPDVWRADAGGAGVCSALLGSSTSIGGGWDDGGSVSG